MISPTSINSMLTELGRANVFRVIHRDDAVGIVACKLPGRSLARQEHCDPRRQHGLWEGHRRGTKEQLNRRGVTEAIYEAYVPGKVNYGVEIDALQAADIVVAFIGGYHTEIGLMARQHATTATRFNSCWFETWRARSLASLPAPRRKERSSLDVADPRRRTEAAPVVERFRASGYEPEGNTLNAYAAVQVWAQAAEKVGSLELPAMIASLREHQFDTVLGTIDFDDKGDLAVQNPGCMSGRGRHLRAAGIAGC